MYKLILVLLLAVFANAGELELVDGKIQAHTEVFGDSSINPSTKKIDVEAKKGDSIESILGKIEIDAVSLVSDNKDRDEHMYEVLKVTDSPKIIYTITSIAKADDKYKINGILTMNHATKPVSSTAIIAQSGEEIVMDGDFSINLTDFNLEPPTMFFLTVRDQIDIKYSFNFKEK